MKLALVAGVLLGVGWAVLVLPGCGGGDDPGSPAPPPPEDLTINGTIDWPAGMSPDAGQLELALGPELVDLDGAGAFTTELRDGSPQLAVLSGPDDAPLLMAWLDSEAAGISPRTTAEALVYFGLGIWALPPDAAEPVCNLLRDPATDLSALTDAIAEQVAANPGGFTAENEAIKTALIQTLGTFYEKVEDLAGKPSPTAGSPDKGLLIEPADEQSGIACLNLGGINKCTLKNSYRRRALTLVKKISWFDAEGEEHFFPTSTPQSFEIPPVAGFAGVVGTIGSAVTGGISYTPVTMPPVQLQNHPGANYTKYWVVTGGMGVVDHTMDIYLTSDQLDQVDWVCTKGVVWDFFVPLMMNMLATANELGALDGLLSEDPEVAGAVLELVGFVMNNMPQVYNAAADGHFKLAMTELYNGLSTTGGFRTFVWDLLRTCLEKMGVAGGDVALALEKAGRFLQIVGWIDIVGSYMDSGVVVAHMAASNHIDVWEVKVTDPAVAVTASQSAIFVCDRVDSLRVRVSDDTGDGLPDGTAYAYRWSCGGRAGTLINPQHPGDDSNDFETSSRKVGYLADTGSAGMDTVKVRVFTRAGSTLTYIGSDSTAIDVQPRHVTVTPAEVSLAPEEEQTFEVAIDPQFSVAVTDSVFFSWTSTASVGDLYSHDGDTAPFETQDPDVRYEAGTDVGDDTLTLQAAREFADGSRTVFATIDVPVEVADFGIILVAHPDTVAPDGIAHADVMATLKLWAPGDTDTPTGDPVVGRTVTFATDLGVLTGDNPATTNAGGNALIALSSDEAGTATLSAECEGVEETVTVEFSRQVHLSPAILHVATDSTRTLTASVNPDFAPGADVLYRWTCAETYGELRGPGGEAPPFDSTEPIAEYTAGDESGSETVSVEVLHASTPGDYVSVGSDLCEVTVGGVGMILGAYPERIFTGSTFTATLEVELRNWNEGDTDVPTGDPVAGESVTFSTSLGTIVGANPVVTDAEGRAVCEVYSDATGTAQLTAESELAGSAGVAIEFVPPDSALLMVRTAGNYLSIYVVWAEVPGATSYTMCWDAHGDPSWGPDGLCPGPLRFDTGCPQTAGDEWQYPGHEIPGYRCFYNWTIASGSGDFGDMVSRCYDSYGHYTFTVAPHFD